jgi:hypothetical protein
MTIVLETCWEGWKLIWGGTQSAGKKEVHSRFCLRMGTPQPWRPTVEIRKSECRRGGGW